MRRRPAAPWWLAHPSRWATVSPERARTVLAVAALLVVLALASLSASAGEPPLGDRAVILHEGIVEGVRHGGDYYQAAADSLREAGLPLRPAVSVPLPTLAVVEAHLPRWGVIAGLWWLTAGVALAWWARAAPLFRGWTPRLLAVLLLAAGLAGLVDPERVGVPAVWAGLLIALSLARRRPGRWGEAVAIALAAATLDAGAAAYLVAMAGLAWFEGDRREAWGWISALAVVAVLLACHAHAVAAVARVGDLAGVDGATWGAPVDTLGAATALRFLPAWFAAILVTLAALGWASLRDPLAVRVAWTVVACTAAAAVAGATEAPLFVAGPVLIGLAMLPDAGRDLFAAVIDTRRIVVRRVVR